jgi:BirA family transcriptional regulator, biotin operon repressor / biotin---[acetyl-CoA-carboxylase] ligase
MDSHGFLMRSQIICHDLVDSTNSEAWRMVDECKLNPDRKMNLDGTAIAAKQQTKGRGQRGHTWQSDLGGLYLSVILQPNLPATYASQITLWSAWSLATALNTTGANVKIKWLNDLLVDGRKLGGLLTETRIEAGIVAYAVIGIGINWLNAVPDHAIALSDLATNIADLDHLTELVVEGVMRGRDRFAQEGIEPILADYVELLNQRSFTTLHMGQEQKGYISDITTTGDLVVIWEGSSQPSIYRPGALSLGYQR